MARRGFGGMTALRAALGAATGVAEGLQERELLAAKRKQEEEANALARFAALRSAGFGFTPVRTAADPAAREAFALEAPELPAPTLGTSQMGTALAKATQGGLGVSGRPTGMLDTPISLALDTSKTRQFERGAGMQAATPAERIKIGGVELGLTAPETEEEKMQRQLGLYQQQRRADVEAERGKVQAKTQAEREAQQQREKDLIATGMSPAEAKRVITLEAKYGDVFMTPGAKLTMRGQDISAATARRGQDLSYLASQERGAGGKGSATEPIQMRIRAGMNEMLLANKSMEDFEQKFKAGQVNITVGQRVLQKLATDFANERTPLDKIITSSAYKALAEANPDLVEYMRNVDAFAEGETMISSRPSNFRTKMAQFLSGIAAGSPVEVVNRVQQRRRGLLTPMVQGYYEGDWNRAMQEASVEAQAPTGTPAATPKSSAEAWMDANPQRQGETDAAYKARYQAAQRGGR